jgi:transcriptional regulator with XRE-family HTH domain
MKSRLMDMGYLIALKQLNRDELARAIGSTRQNLIAAVKGRRPLPARQVPLLRHELALDDRYLLAKGRVHGLTVSNGEKQGEMALSVLRAFMAWPVRRQWYLRGIGEACREGFAYVFEDSRGVLVALRNDDTLLSDVSRRFPETEDAPAGSGEIFLRREDIPKREASMRSFDGIFSGGTGEEDCRAMLRRGEKVWTWARLREEAEQAGLSAEDLAARSGLYRIPFLD